MRNTLQDSPYWVASRVRRRLRKCRFTEINIIFSEGLEVMKNTLQDSPYVLRNRACEET